MRKIIGAGLSCLDIIHDDKKTIIQNGGTCSNVLSALSALGWKSSIIKAQYDEPYNAIMDEIFNTLDVETLDFKRSKTSAPRIIEKRDKDHVFYTKCPICDNKILNLSLPTEKNINSLQIDYSNTKAFFHDRVSSGIKRVLECMATEDIPTIYEPNSCRNEKVFFEHCFKCNVIKFSNDRISFRIAERLHSMANSNNSRIKLIICTDADKGLRFSFCEPNKRNEMSPWQAILPMYSKRVYDTSGAGDWFTAGFLNEWLSDGSSEPIFEETTLVNALENAREYAMKSTSFLGAQGILYSKEFMAANNRLPLVHNNSIMERFDLSDVCSYCGEKL